MLLWRKREPNSANFRLVTKVDSINKHVCSIDAKVLHLQNKVTTLESSLKKNAKAVSELEAGITFLNTDVEEMKVKANKTTDEVHTLRQFLRDSRTTRRAGRHPGSAGRLHGEQA